MVEEAHAVAIEDAPLLQVLDVVFGVPGLSSHEDLESRLCVHPGLGHRLGPAKS